MTFTKKAREPVQIAVRRKPRQARSFMTVEAILEAARILFARDGFEATSTTRIAEVAGVSVGSLYEYFTSKEALVAKLIKCHCDYLMALYGNAFKAVEGQGLEALVDAWIDTTADAYAENVALQRVLLEQMGRVSKLRHLQRVSMAFTDLLEQALRVCGEPIGRPDLHLAAFVMESAGEALIHRSIIYTADLFGYELRRELKVMLILYLRAGVSGGTDN
ncbi:TetR/AcrR family transcriptional regulator [Ralstonia soli]|uniref:TetR/AcrR family transcriptional regulator n=1 Tax=Ralstonia soli TaxID=2953896 RepID=A0ABT1AMN4_9RALS|nr:TetR/AcrR family transcriptional regulator [Ralstonia soli]MCO5399700.1 TetR/AcrR family transcriptional regulator [Ralstonia soli]